MKLRLLAALLVAAAGLPALAQTAPATLPAGHPPITGAMPAGHPDIGAAGSLPAGHPSLEALQAATAPVANDTGVLTLTVLQGTQGGPAIKDAPVTVELYHEGQVVKKIDVTLASDGTLKLEHLPIALACQALISIPHGGTIYQGLSPVLDATNPSQHVDMKLYETTIAMPAWTVGTRHIILQSHDNELVVTEMLNINNPTDHTWLGAGSGKDRVTLSLALPPAAGNIDLIAGFDEDSTRQDADHLLTAGAFFPGDNQFRFTYTLPLDKGAVTLPIVAPAPVGRMMVFLPADAAVTATGLDDAKIVNMGAGPVHAYFASNLAPNSVATVTISGLAAPAAPAAPGLFSARNVAIVGGLVILVVGVGLLFLKRPPIPAQKP